jgi:hypothetical protein
LAFAVKNKFGNYPSCPPKKAKAGKERAKAGKERQRAGKERAKSGQRAGKERAKRAHAAPPTLKGGQSHSILLQNSNKSPKGLCRPFAVPLTSFNVLCRPLTSLCRLFDLKAEFIFGSRIPKKN